jgi:hypothetical protein
MQGDLKALKSAICGGGALKWLPSRSCVAAKRFARHLQGGCGGAEGLCEDRDYEIFTIEEKTA